MRRRWDGLALFLLGEHLAEGLAHGVAEVADLGEAQIDGQEQTAAADEDQNGNAPEPVTKILNSLQYNHTFLLSRETIGDFLCDCACAFCVLCLVRFVRFDRVSQRREG